MRFPQKIRVTDLGEFWKDDGDDYVLISCIHSGGEVNEPVQPGTPEMEFMKELVRCYNIVHAKR